MYQLRFSFFIEEADIRGLPSTFDNVLDIQQISDNSIEGTPSIAKVGSSSIAVSSPFKITFERQLVMLDQAFAFTQAYHDSDNNKHLCITVEFGLPRVISMYCLPLL